MRQFTKQTGCPAAATLVAYQDGALSVLARQATAAHLTNCEFCAAEAQLLGAHRAPAAADAATPPVPFALLALAESALAASPRVAEQRRRRAA